MTGLGAAITDSAMPSPTGYSNPSPQQAAYSPISSQQSKDVMTDRAIFWHLYSFAR
jgi:hypothetical protein